MSHPDPTTPTARDKGGSPAQLIGDGVIHLAAVDQLRAIGKAAPGLLDAVIAYLDDGNAWPAERLTRETGWVLDAALTHSGDGKVFAAYLHSASSPEIAELRLGKKTEQLYEQAGKLHKQLDRYAYGPPQVRFTDEDVDQARAAGVLIEFERGRPIIVDRPLYSSTRAVVSSSTLSPRSSSQPLTCSINCSWASAVERLYPRHPSSVSNPSAYAANGPATRTRTVLAITAPFVRSHDQTKEPRRDPP